MKIQNKEFSVLVRKKESVSSLLGHTGMRPLPVEVELDESFGWDYISSKESTESCYCFVLLEKDPTDITISNILKMGT